MMMGRVKTKVFPEPVKAMPIMSRPERLQTNAVKTSAARYTDTRKVWQYPAVKNGSFY